MMRVNKHLLTALFCILLAFPVVAEIVVLEGNKVVAGDSAYVYAHPSLRSVVFASTEAREMAILPPAPYFLSAPPLLLRAPSPYAAYPPVVYQSGVNATARPSNRDLATYNMGRAHAFSQELYYPGTAVDLSAVPVYYASPISIMPYYPPAARASGLNQTARPSNRDNTTYNLERAHRFSMDAYKKP